ncbi:MAG: EamA family transporter [Candidatus Sericytochromatia bacterium]|nr:EamA family transporter [Candidatus Sericytochromatia bacterium]
MRDTPDGPSRLALAVALGTVYVIWGSTYLAIRIAVQGMPPFVGAALRFWSAGLILMVLGAVNRHARPTRIQAAGAGLVGLFFLLGGNGGIVWAEQYLSSGMAALIQATTPLWVLIIEAALPGGARPSLISSLGTALGFAGVGMLIWPSLQSGSQGGPLFAQVVLLAAAVSWACGTIVGRRVAIPSSALYNTGIANLVGATALAGLAAWQGEWGHVHWAAVPSSAWWALAYLTIFGSCIGFSAVTWLVRNAKPHIATTYAFVNPAVAVALGALFLHEPLQASTVGGAMVIILAVTMVILGSRKRTVPLQPVTMKERG